MLARARLALAVLALAGATSAAFAAPCGTTSAASDSTPLCTGDPNGTTDCTISADCTLQSGLTLDLKARRLVVAASKTLTVTDEGLLTVKANGIVLQPGAKIVAQGDNTGAQTVILTSTAAFTLADGSLIDVSSGGGGGDVELYAPAGGFTSTGSIRANNGTGRDADGGFVSIEALNDVSIGGAVQTAIDASGGDRDGGGGFITVTSDAGATTIGAPIDAHGGGFDGGDVEFDANTNVVTTPAATIQIEAEGPGGSGGSLAINAEGQITLGGNVTGTPQGDQDNGSGDGADVDLESDTGNISVTALVDVSGVEPDGDGGSFTAATDGDVTITGKIALQTPGAASGGDAEFDGNNVTVSSVVDASGSPFGGTVDVSANGLAKLTGGGVFRVDSDNAPGSFGGEITIQGCSVELDAGTTISALGPATLAPAASTIIQASSSLVVGGTIVSGGFNEFDYRDDLGIIQILKTASITPKQMEVALPNLPCCDAACATTTTTTVPATSTTTSTAPATTTTTRPITTTTTSTVPVTTTTTTVPATSTTTSTIPATTTTTQPTTTTSSTTSTTSSTTTSSAPPTTSTTSTAVTTTTSPLATSTTVASTTTSSTGVASTTTTVTAPLPTTTTTQPPPCSGEPSSLDGASCLVQMLNSTLETSTPAELGGARTKRRLNTLLKSADHYLDAARSGKRVTAKLRSARRKLNSFEHVVQQAMQRKRGPLNPQIGQLILDVVSGAASEIEVAASQ